MAKQAAPVSINSAEGQSKEQLQAYLDNLGTEYRYKCYEDKDPEACRLLGEYLLRIEGSAPKAAQLFMKTCDSFKHPASCDTAGRLACRGLGFPKQDYKLAADYFIKGCQYGDLKSCYHGGQLFSSTEAHIMKEVPTNVDKALEMLTKACKSAKVPPACSLIHSFYLQGLHDRPADLKKAAEFAEIACEQNEVMGCANLGRMYHLGDGVESDQDKARHFLKRAKDVANAMQQKLDQAAKGN